MAFTARTGWRGLILLGSDYIRFTNETITISPGIKILTDLHAGIRTDSVYQYELVTPSGNISFPLTTDNVSTFPGSANDISTGIKTLFTNALAEEALLGQAMTIYRGDVTKTIDTPYIETLTLSGKSNDIVTVEAAIKGTFGTYTFGNTEITPNLPVARALMFNELDWSVGIPNMTLSGDDVGLGLTPRSFDLTIKTGLIEDSSYNAVAGKKRALRGFAAGKYEITGKLTFVGAAANAFPAEYENDFTPWSAGDGAAGLNIGGLFTITDGIYKTRTMNIPAVTDIAVTELEFHALGTGNTQPIIFNG